MNSDFLFLSRASADKCIIWPPEGSHALKTYVLPRDLVGSSMVRDSAEPFFSPLVPKPGTKDIISSVQNLSELTFLQKK